MKSRKSPFAGNYYLYSCGLLDKSFELTRHATIRWKFKKNYLHRTVGIRIGVKKGGCNGYVYTMHFAESVNKADEVVKEGGQYTNLL